MNEVVASRIVRYGMCGCIVPAIMCVLFAASSLIPVMTSTDTEWRFGAASAGDALNFSFEFGDETIGYVDLPGEGHWVYCNWSGTLSYLSDPGYIPPS